METAYFILPDKSFLNESKNKTWLITLWKELLECLYKLTYLNHSLFTVNRRIILDALENIQNNPTLNPIDIFSNISNGKILRNQYKTNNNLPDHINSFLKLKKKESYPIFTNIERINNKDVLKIYLNTESIPLNKINISDTVIAQKLIDLKTSADKRDIEFDISFKKLKSIWKLTKCQVTGVIFDSAIDSNDSKTIDRVDNSKGYIDSNIIVCTKRINNLKANASIQDIQNMYKLITKFKLT